MIYSPSSHLLLKEYNLSYIKNLLALLSFIMAVNGRLYQVHQSASIHHKRIHTALRGLIKAF